VAAVEKPSFRRVSSGARRSSYWIAAIAMTMKASPASPRQCVSNAAEILLQFNKSDLEHGARLLG
jgi:hypothetical protein